MKGLVVLLGLLLLAGTVFGVSDDTPQTKLLVFMNLIEDPSDSNHLTALVTVENIGKMPSIRTDVNLQNIPADWVVSPDASANLKNIRPRSQKIVTFDIRKGSTDASIFAVAQAANAPAVSSDVIPVPVHPLVSLAMMGGFAGLMFVSRKRFSH